MIEEAPKKNPTKIVCIWWDMESNNEVAHYTNVKFSST